MKSKWNGNFQEKNFENLGIPQEVVLFSGKLCKFVIFFFSASSLAAITASRTSQTKMKATLIRKWSEILVTAKYLLQINSSRKRLILVKKSHVVYLFVLRRLAKKCTKIYNACRAIVPLITPFVLRHFRCCFGS